MCQGTKKIFFAAEKRRATYSPALDYNIGEAANSAFCAKFAKILEKNNFNFLEYFGFYGVYIGFSRPPETHPPRVEGAEIFVFGPFLAKIRTAEGADFVTP